jgi:hypothetical protein
MTAPFQHIDRREPTKANNRRQLRLDSAKNLTVKRESRSEIHGGITSADTSRGKAG